MVSLQISMYREACRRMEYGRFYNGRHHTTVLHAIQKIELLRSRDESVNALLDVLTLAVNRKEESRAELPEAEWMGSVSRRLRTV